MKTFTQFQIGKAGITVGTIDSLALAFKNHKAVRISCLPSSGRNRTSIVPMGSELSRRLSEKTPNVRYDFRIIGFTIVLTRHRSNSK